jgi:hypothetical protein
MTALRSSQLHKMSIKTPTVKFTTTNDEIPVVGMVCSLFRYSNALC